MNNINGLTSATADLQIANTVDSPTAYTIDSPLAVTIDPPTADTAAAAAAVTVPTIDLEQWCEENKLNPVFKYTYSYGQETLVRTNVFCELIITGYNYIGHGSSKDEDKAKKIAIEDFLLFLVREHKIPAIPEREKESIQELEISPDIPTTNSENIYVEIENPLIAEKEKRLNSTPKIFSVEVNKKLMNDVYSLLEDLKMEPVFSKNYGAVCKDGNLIINKDPKKFDKLNQNRSGIAWCPPISHYNTWSNTTIDEPISLTELSDNLKIQMYNKKYSRDFLIKTQNRTYLPIFQKREEILSAISFGPVVIVKGKSGCGKTTQICQYILEEYIQKNNGAYCNIICTQPNKLSVVSAANRVAFERAEFLRESVGYSIGFDNKSPRPFGSILFCTAENVIRKLKRGLKGISHIIIDDVHERRADCEFLLTVLKDILLNFTDLKVILTSINENLDIYLKYFKNSRIVHVKGRCFPVKEYFLEDIVQMMNYEQLETDIPITRTKPLDLNCNLLVSHDYPSSVRKTIAKIDEKGHYLQVIESLLVYIENNLRTRGAVLIFLPGFTWISKLKNYLERNQIFAEKFTILTLHSKLSHVKQYQVFQPIYGKRKVILSTTIAEQSITISDVVYVIDYGKSNEMSYSNGKTEIITGWVSKVNLEQRKGRAGRCQAGICFNLYTKERYKILSQHVCPEITYYPLTKIALCIKLLQLGDIQTFLKKTIRPPSEESMINVTDMLKELKCLTANGEVTALGSVLAHLPLEPRFGRMMILGHLFMLGDAMSILASGLSNDYCLFKGNSHKIVHLNFAENRCSDQLSYLNRFIEHESHSAGINCPQEYNVPSSELHTAYNVRNQVKSQFKRFGFPDCCFRTQHFGFGNVVNFHEPKLDVLSALLTMACYPNVYIYEEDGKVQVKNQSLSVVPQNSINCHGMGSNCPFPFPFFVFKKLKHRLCMESTMVTPIHLLLFGARTVAYIRGSIVLDDWIHLKMDVDVAAAIVALRPAIDDLILKIAETPKCTLNLSFTDKRLLKTIMDLCDFRAVTCNLIS